MPFYPLACIVSLYSYMLLKANLHDGKRLIHWLMIGLRWSSIVKWTIKEKVLFLVHHFCWRDCELDVSPLFLDTIDRSAWLACHWSFALRDLKSFITEFSSCFEIAFLKSKSDPIITIDQILETCQAQLVYLFTSPTWKFYCFFSDVCFWSAQEGTPSCLYGSPQAK